MNQRDSATAAQQISKSDVAELLWCCGPCCGQGGYGCGRRVLYDRHSTTAAHSARTVLLMCISIIGGDSSDTHRKGGQELPPLSTFGVPQKVASKDREGEPTRMQCVIDRIAHPDSGLCETHKIQAGGDPAVFPCHGIHPGRVEGGRYKIIGRCD